ncbi:tautomerase family protein [Microbispora sp. H13382]|uniref:tautomerase family protein n=1 Tax=Microbispora sp. H13382 TaxID=2729112 RepID=UPI0015FF2973|nr:tautomerase family protein [Microbispora sp. H13382]
MPHVNIKHFPVTMTPEQQTALMTTITQALENALGCEAGAVSIALEPIDPEEWQEKVYGPEIRDRAHLLCKTPDY